MYLSLAFPGGFALSVMERRSRRRSSCTNVVTNCFKFLTPPPTPPLHGRGVPCGSFGRQPLPAPQGEGSGVGSVAYLASSS